MTARTLLIGLGGAALLLAGGVAAGFWAERDGVVTSVDRDAGRVVADADAIPAELVRQPEPIYHAFNPPITANLKDTGALLQAGISVETHYASVDQALEEDDPALRSAIIFALSDADEEVIVSDAGKEQLLGKIAEAVNRRLASDGYRGTIDAAYFTTFVVQPGSDAD